MKSIIQFLLITLLFQNSSLSAQDKTWTGASSDNWNIASNWNPNGVPSATDEVDIPDVTNDPRIPSILIVNIKSLTVKNEAKLTIQGNAILNIKDAPLNGILNEGTIENSGEININDIGGGGLDNSGIRNEGIFTNKSTAEIKMSNIINAGIRNYQTFNNAGKITIEPLYFLARGILVFAAFHNQVGGDIQIKGLSSGIACFAPFTNDGKIVVSSYSSNGIVSQAGFSNTTTEQIFLDSGSWGIACNANTFTNEGKINIGANAAPTTGIAVEGGGFNQFVNKGELNIYSATEKGISIDDQAKFFNSGKIAIGQNQVGGDGIENFNIFENEAGAELTIHSANQFGIENGNSLSDFSGFGTPVLPPAQFTNHPCAILRVKARIFNAKNGAFTNKGFLFSDYQGNHSNQETFVNEGVIEDLHTAFNGNIDNQDIIIHPKSNCSSNVFMNVLQIGNDNSFAVSSNWYSEETLTNVVGTYNASSNTFTSSLTAGSHVLYFEATDNDNNCTQIMRIPLGLSGSFLVTISGDLNYCASDNFTTLDAGSWTSYEWSNNETTQKIEAGEGTYTVIVTDSNGCTSTDEVTVVENPNPNPSIGGNLEYCASDNFTVLDAGNGTSYKWSSGQTNQKIEASEGTYTVTITNSNGCTGTDEATVVENSNPSPSIGGNLEYCASDNFTVLDAGNGTSYKWSNGETSQKIEASEGAYTVTITNSNGCTGTDEATVVENANPNPSISGNLEYCASANFTTLDAGNGTSYKWSNGETTQKIEASEGTYTVTVTNSNGCTGTDEVTVVENANPSPSITGVLEYCASDNFTTLDAGTWKTYKWSNGETNQVIEANEGTYTVTVTNAHDCTGTDEVMVVENANPSPNITGTFDYCRGRQATLDAGNWANYQWSNDEISQFFSTTAIGIYTVTVTNQEGCTGTARASVSMKPCFAEAGVLTTNANTICGGEAIEVSTTSNSTDNNYLQYFFLYTQDNLGNTLLHNGTIESMMVGESSANFEGLAAGDYLVCSYNECQDCLPNPSPITTDLDDIYQTGTIQDGCFDIECTSITVPESFELNIEGSGQVTGTNSTEQSIFIAEVCGGTAPYSIDFDYSGGFAAVNDLPSDNAGCVNYQIVYGTATDWILVVTDANNCNNESVIFTSDGLPSNPLPQIVDFMIVPETCVGDGDGSIAIEVEGGDGACGDYTYTWSSTNGFSANVVDGTTGNTANNLASGFYDVTVTDCAGTIAVQDIYVGRGSGRGRGRGGCKTVGNRWDESEALKVFPNPFAEQTMIEFSLPLDAKVWLSAYSMDGRKVAELLEGVSIEGERLQRVDFESRGLQNGIYILELQTELGERFHQKLMVTK